jgi:hypothetical protein
MLAGATVSSAAITSNGLQLILVQLSNDAAIQQCAHGVQISADLA